MIEIKKIEIMSLGKIMCLVSAMFGLVAGICITVLSVGGFLKTEAGDPLPLAEFSFIIYPIFYAITGFLGGIITAVFYNLASKWLGGIRINKD